MNSKLGLPSRCSTLNFWLVNRLSRQMTSWPWATSRSQMCDPRNPAPPVTRTRLRELAMGGRCLSELRGRMFDAGASRVFWGMSRQGASCGRRRWPRSVREPEPDDGQDRLDPVLPGDLLPLLVAAAVVRHAHLV